MADNPRTGNKAAAGGAGAVVGIGILVSILWGFEGNRPVTYLDPVGIPTVCVGHTGSDVKLGDRKTDDECRALLTGDALEAWDDVERYVTVPLQPYEHAAFASFDFNVGAPAFRGSTMLRLINAGQVSAACRELPRWTWAGPPTNRVQLPGLVKRRAAEMKLCLGQGV